MGDERLERISWVVIPRRDERRGIRRQRAPQNVRRAELTGGLGSHQAEASEGPIHVVPFDATRPDQGPVLGRLRVVAAVDQGPLALAVDVRPQPRNEAREPSQANFRVEVGVEAWHIDGRLVDVTIGVPVVPEQEKVIVAPGAEVHALRE